MKPRRFSRLRLRDGESNLLAGLLREDERKALNGVPGAIKVPILKQLFSNNDQTIAQTDIVMLLTPHIIRAPEITVADLKPLYIGTQNNLGIGGPPPLIAGPEPAAETPAAAPPPAQPPILAPPPGSSPVPGLVPVPAPAPATPPGGAAAAPTPAAPTTADVPVSTPGIGAAQVLVSPEPTFRVGGGPYLVPITITNVSRLSMISLTLTFDPALLRPRTTSEGSFMRSGGTNATFTSQAGNGRVDITIVRSADATGATGTGLLGAVQFDAIAPGTSTFGLSGTATGPGGTPMGLQFRPVTITIQP